MKSVVGAKFAVRSRHGRGDDMISHPTHRPRGSAGFGLIELVTAMVVIAILMMVALPTYRQAIAQVRRSEGQNALLKTMQQQEQVYTQRTAYLAFTATSSDPDAARFKWYSGDSAPSSAYEITAAACPGMQLADCVIVSAKPGTPRVNASYIDKTCGTLWLDSFGKKGADGANCW